MYLEKLINNRLPWADHYCVPSRLLSRCPFLNMPFPFGLGWRNRIRFLWFFDVQWLKNSCCLPKYLLCHPIFRQNRLIFLKFQIFSKQVIEWKTHLQIPVLFCAICVLCWFVCLVVLLETFLFIQLVWAASVVFFSFRTLEGTIFFKKVFVQEGCLGFFSSTDFLGLVNKFPWVSFLSFLETACLVSLPA